MEVQMGMRSKISDESFSKAIKENVSIAAALKSLGLTPNGASYRMVRIRIQSLDLDTSHILGQGHLKGKKNKWAKKIPMSEILIENSSYSSMDRLKKRLVKEGLLDYECNECGISTWRDKPFTLQLEHKNGINSDHRIENLCFLCPNCHSQTPTFAGRNKGRYATLPHSNPAIIANSS
jgi:hypothetical protein